MFESRLFSENYHMRTPLQAKPISLVICLFVWAGLVPVGVWADQPNILFIVADDLSYDSVGSAGNQVVRTPNLDGLARQGMTFSHAYNMGAWNGVVCAASRTMLNTGHSLWRAQVDHENFKKPGFTSTKPLWAQRLSAAGYDTYMTGKWHVEVPAANVFDVAKDVRGGMPNQVKSGYDRPKNADDKQWLPWDVKQGGYWKGGKHWSEVVADDALQFIEQAKSKNDPFFMYIAFNAPHDPRQSPKEIVESYSLDDIPLPQPFFEEYPFDLKMNRIRDEQLAPLPRTKYAVKVNRLEYYAIITHMDQQIGRILDGLKNSGQAENTYIFFTADHGLAVGHHGLMGKQNLYEHSIRVPFFVAGPDVPKKTTCPQQIYLQDVMPTTLEIAHVPIADDIEFKSVLPLVKNKSHNHYQAIYGAYMNSQRSVTAGNYKLIVYPELGRKLLFDLVRDPNETRSLADEPEYQVALNELMGQLAEQQQKFGDPLRID